MSEKLDIKTTKIKDYYTQTVKDIPIYYKDTYIYYRKRRYVCKQCGKKFYEKNNRYCYHLFNSNHFSFLSATNTITIKYRTYIIVSASIVISDI